MKLALSILAVSLVVSIFGYPNIAIKFEFLPMFIGFILSVILDYLVKSLAISSLGSLDNRKVIVKYNVLWIFLSSGYFLSKVFKDSIKYKNRVFRLKQEKAARAKFISNANKYNLWASSVVLAFITLFSLTDYLSLYINVRNILIWFVVFRVVSRCVEIVYAFTNDVIKNKESNSSTLTKYDRIKLALNSYVESIINFSVVYYFFDKASIGDAVLTSLGRSTISNLNLSGCRLEQFLAYGQVLTSLILVVLSLAIYVSRNK